MLHACLNNIWCGVRRNREIGTYLRKLRNLVRVQHGPGTNHRSVAQLFDQSGNAVEWSRRIQRHFDGGDAGLNQGLSDCEHVFRQNAPQYGNQGRSIIQVLAELV